MENEVRYFDDDFFELEPHEQIKYLKENGDVEIYPEQAEEDYFYDLARAVLEKGEEDLYIALLEKYFNAAVALSQEIYYRRVRPNFDAIYEYADHLLNHKITPFEEMDMDVKRMLVSFCVMNEYIESCDFDDFLDAYPLLTTFYENFCEIAYADDDAFCPMLLLSIGYAYRVGTKYFPQNEEKAFSFFATGAELDYSGRQSSWPFEKVAECAYEVGLCYKEGRGVEKDFDAALSYFENAARDFGLEYLPEMAEIYLDPDFDWTGYFDDKESLIFSCFDALFDSYRECPKELGEQVITEIKALSNGGNLDATFRLAKAYEKGIFVEKDLKEALCLHNELMIEGTYPHSALFFFENHTPRKRESYKIPDNLKVGDNFILGEMLGEPLSWRVMQIHEDGPVVLSEKVLAVLPFGNYGADFEASFVRKWLNEQFFNKAFTEEEQDYILKEQYYAQSFKGYKYVGNIILEDYLFLPNSSDIEEWFGEGKEEWKVEYTDFAERTGNSTDCWLINAETSECPKHVNENNTKSRFRYQANCKLGIRPMMILK